MIRKQLRIHLLIAFGALLVGVVVGRFLLGPSADDPHGHPSPSVAAASHSPKTDFWTCAMHPQIRQPGPGKCPICGMDLVPVGNGGADDDGPRTLTMSEAAKALAEVQTSPVIRDFPEAEVRLVGKLDFDETRLRSLSARFPARIDKLYVNFTGIEVQKGDHLAVVYSPDLLTAQRELLTAMQYDPEGSAARVARDKLRLWDLLPEQIEGIIGKGTAEDSFELRAPIGGVVVHKNFKEGDYVKTGDSLFRIADLSTLWLPLKAYESDLQWLRYGQTAVFEVESFPGEHFKGRIVFIDPLLDTKTRTIDVRVEVPNRDGRLKPGMFARAVVYSRVASGGRVIAPELAGKWISPMHPEIVKDGPGKCDVCGMDLVPVESLGYVSDAGSRAPLVVPTSAVLRTGKRAVVYVSVPDRGKPTFEGREITIGPRAGDVFLVVDGLEEGDEVVTRGAFKIDSALQIQAKPSMMSERGEGRGTEDAGHEAHGAGELLEIDAGTLQIDVTVAKALLSGYLALQGALARDNLAAAEEALRSMMEMTGHAGPLAGLVHRMLARDSLDLLRVPDFDALSQALIAALKADPSRMDEEVSIAHCPMANGGEGADWIQMGSDVRNPYFGDAMLTCGEITDTIGGNQR